MIWRLSPRACACLSTRVNCSTAVVASEAGAPLWRVAYAADGESLEVEAVGRVEYPEARARVVSDVVGIADVAPTVLDFAGLQFWPGGPDWSVDARFIAHPPGKTLPIVNIVNMVEEVPNPGLVEFQRDGKTHRLEVLDQGEPTLFLVYADRTSGHGSYPAGRYLDIARPGADGRVKIDFNHGENPPCAFTPYATCPLPPPANRLDLAVVAGEKVYAKH